ncbi:MAG TPA: hypothetical protein VI670_23710 [Thermoanaerobaculia bacterium]|jgi:hypothetical protein
MFALIFLLYSLTFSATADQGSGIDPDGYHADSGGAMDPNG